MRLKTILPISAAAMAIVVAGCGGTSSGGSSKAPVDPNTAEVNPAGDIPDDQAFVPYAPSGAGYSVDVPEGWARTTAGGATTFTDKLNAIRIEARSAATPLTAAQAQRTELPKLARSVPGFKAGQVSTVDRKAGKAVRITFLAAAKTDPVTGKAGTDAVERYLFFHGGRELVLTLAGPKGADNVDPWRIVTDSVHWTR